MCWISNNKPVIKVAEENILIFKICMKMLSKEDCVQSYYWEFVYRLNREYDILEEDGVDTLDYYQLLDNRYRIVVEYNKEGWQVNHNVMTDNYYRVLPQSTKENVYHIMTKQQEEGICTYFETLIKERKKQIEKAKNNPDFKVFSTYCVDMANEILKSTEYKCKLSYGKSQVDNVETWALVIYDGDECNDYTQVGYIRISRNKFNEYCFTCSTMGCRYSNSCPSMNGVYPILKGMIKFLTN